VSAYHIHQLFLQFIGALVDPNTKTSANVCMKQCALVFQFAKIQNGIPLLPQLLSVILQNSSTKGKLACCASRKQQ
jgi:hypothetical protein